MEYVYLPFETKSLEPNGLRLTKAKEFRDAISHSEHSRMVECFILTDQSELIIFETEPIVGQVPVNDIRFTERIAVHFTVIDDVIPWVYALRSDFPRVSHLNAMTFEYPRCLCLYESPYEELKRDWRGAGFLERIREWLKETADGTLHHDDQPLEPFFISTVGSLIFTERLDAKKELFLQLVSTEPELDILASHKTGNTSAFHALPLVIETEPQIHGIIRKAPANLTDLLNILTSLGVDIVEKLRRLINHHYVNRSHHKLLIIIVVPKKRSELSDVTSGEFLAFLTTSSIVEIGLSTKLLTREAGMIAPVWPAEALDADRAALIGLNPLRVYIPLSRYQANVFNNIAPKNPKIKIVLIGAGALGSQVFAALTRMGYGRWTIIDKDILLPHNLARHLLLDSHVGYNKGLSISFVANSLIGDSSHSDFIIDDIIKPKDEAKITEKLTGADTILDISASIPVARRLCELQEISARRISCFLSPSGKDMVMLAENKNRDVTLDRLEMQYYRMLISSDDLREHLETEQSIRYSTSCRDVTSRISQDNVLTLSGIAVKALLRLSQTPDDSYIGIWQTKDDGSVAFHKTTIYKSVVVETHGWSIVFDEFLLNKLNVARDMKLPLETGGVLIGSYDLSRKIIYIVDSILSPADSKEYPTAYYRGIAGLGQKLNEIANRTSGHLIYLGEWHSHPKGTALSMSEDDKKLFKWILEHMKPMGYPPLMVIVGDNGFSAYCSIL